MIKLKVNKIIKFLLISDFIFWAGWGLISPIFSVFIVQYVNGGNAFVAGVSSAIYSIIIAFLRVPMGMFLDSRSSEKVDYIFTASGLAVASFSAFGFAFSTLIWHIYVLQVMHAVAMAMNFSGFTALFSRNIDKGRESTEWGIDSTAVNIASAASAVIGGAIVMKFGYPAVFALVGCLGLLGAGALLFIAKDLEKKGGRGLYFSLKDILQRELENRD